MNYKINLKMMIGVLMVCSITGYVIYESIQLNKT